MNIPDVIDQIRAYYRLPGNEAGGIVHIVLEDGNIAQKDADWCLEQALDHGDENDIEIARIVAGLSRTQRKKIAYAL